jgi:hypothetical protein
MNMRFILLTLRQIMLGYTVKRLPCKITQALLLHETVNRMLPVLLLKYGMSNITEWQQPWLLPIYFGEKLLRHERGVMKNEFAVISKLKPISKRA